MTVRVLVVDDQELVRSGLCMMLESQPGIEVVGEAADGAEAVAAAGRLAPDVVLMDVRMPVLDGIEATRRICAVTDARVLVLTTYDLDEYVYDALRAGASGFLLKDMRREELVSAVNTIASGAALLAPTVTQRLIVDMMHRRPEISTVDDRRLRGLTARELDTLREVARGQSNAEIAAALYVTEHTVKTHVSNLLAKLGLRDRVQAVVLAYETGLVVPGERGGSRA
jgi:DNA-binding NarL/FixJ family response regulator